MLPSRSVLMPRGCLRPDEPDGLTIDAARQRRQLRGQLMLAAHEGEEQIGSPSPAFAVSVTRHGNGESRSPANPFGALSIATRMPGLTPSFSTAGFPSRSSREARRDRAPAAQRPGKRGLQPSPRRIGRVGEERLERCDFCRVAVDEDDRDVARALRAAQSHRHLPAMRGQAREIDHERVRRAGAHRPPERRPSRSSNCASCPRDASRSSPLAPLGPVPVNQADARHVLTPGVQTSLALSVIVFTPASARDTTQPLLAPSANC